MTGKSISRIGILLLLGAWALFLGCSHYRLGTNAELSFKSIYIAPPDSQTLAPQARALIGARVREVFLRDSRVILSDSPDKADAILHITLKNYGREATVANATDAGLARKFALQLKVSCTLTLHDGKVLFENRLIDAQKEMYVDGGQLQSEYETLPYLADSLATNICHAVLDTW
jgi:outer membrane lipopolysaccharide assembly protein LptE/RlpB